MSGIKDLNTLLKHLRPELSESEYVFCSIQAPKLDLFYKLNPICTFKEKEGTTLVLEKSVAEKENLKVEEIFKRITLQVHSSLEAVGLTAAVSKALADAGISANVIAAYHHDHIFVPTNKSSLALKILQELTNQIT